MNNLSTIVTVVTVLAATWTLRRAIRTVVAELLKPVIAAVEALQQDVNKLKTAVGALKDDNSILKEGAVETKAVLTTLQADVGTLKEGAAATKAVLLALQETTGEVKSDLSDVKDDVVEIKIAHAKEEGRKEGREEMRIELASRPDDDARHGEVRRTQRYRSAGQREAQQAD